MLGIKAILDLNFELTFIENILIKYLKYPENGIYIKGIRHSITDKQLIRRMRKKGMLSNNPFHPIYSAELLSRIAYLTSYDLNPYRDIIRTNPLIKNGYNAKELYPCPPKGVSTVQDIIIDFVHNITHSDYINILKYVNLVIDKLTVVFDENPSAVYYIDIDTDKFKIMIGDDVTKLRYYEALDSHKEISYD